jgi:hypothetical protein
MKYQTQMRALMQKTDAGLVVPSGMQQDSTGYESTGLLIIKERAEEIEKMYESAGIVLPAQCSLADLSAKAKLVADKWMLNRDREVSPLVQLEVTHFGRIAESVLLLSAA